MGKKSRRQRPKNMTQTTDQPPVQEPIVEMDAIDAYHRNGRELTGDDVLQYVEEFENGEKFRLHSYPRALADDVIRTVVKSVFNENDDADKLIRYLHRLTMIDAIGLAKRMPNTANDLRDDRVPGLVPVGASGLVFFARSIIELRLSNWTKFRNC
jgi:hypothetical protein